MEFHKVVYDKRQKKKFFIDVLDYSFPLLCYVSFKCNINDDLCYWPMDLLYDEEAFKKRKLFSDALSEKTGEKEISFLTRITGAGFLHYCAENPVAEKSQRQALQIILSVDNCLKYADRAIALFVLKNENPVVSELAYLKTNISQFVYRYPRLPVGYVPFLREHLSLYNKAQSKMARISLLFADFFSGTLLNLDENCQERRRDM